MLILSPAAFAPSPANAAGVQVDWVRTRDGRSALDHGRCALALLPRDEDCVWVLPPQRVSWHRLSWPKVAPNRLRATLEGLLEEHLLGDVGEMHLALAPGAQAGQPSWVAAVPKGWLQSWLQALEAAQCPVSRIVPALWPGAAAVHWVHQQPDQAWVLSTSGAGACCLPLNGFAAAQAALASAQPGAEAAPEGAAPLWLVEPPLAEPAEQLLDRRLALCSRADWLLRCAQAEGNLAQFGFSLSGAARRAQGLRRWAREVRSAPAWRPARWGLVALLVVQVVGLNLWAWSERRALQAKQAALSTVLQSRFPDITLVLDAPVQLQRERDRLRGASGVLSLADLETQLAGLVTASGGEPVPLVALEFSPTAARFVLQTDPGARWPAWQDALARAGWQATLSDNTLSLRAAGAPGSLP